MSKGKRLEEIILRSRYKNVSQLSKASGVPYTTIRSLIERDMERASIDSIVKIAKALNVSVEYLIAEDKGKTETPSSEYTYLPTSISAGMPHLAEAVAEYETRDISVPDSVMGKWAGDKDIFMMRINGESMNNIIPNSSLIAVKPAAYINLKDGDIVVYSDDQDYAVKRFYQHGSSLVFRPESNDPAFYDHVTDTSNERLVIHGKVVVYIVELD